MLCRAEFVRFVSGLPLQFEDTMEHELDLVSDVVQFESLDHDVLAALLQLAKGLLLLDLLDLLELHLRAIDLHSSLDLGTEGAFSHFVERPYWVHLQLILLDHRDYLRLELPGLLHWH